jgi:hypothetical protein
MSWCKLVRASGATVLGAQSETTYQPDAVQHLVFLALPEWAHED